MTADQDLHRSGRGTPIPTAVTKIRASQASVAQHPRVLLNHLRFRARDEHGGQARELPVRIVDPAMRSIAQRASRIPHDPAIGPGRSQIFATAAATLDAHERGPHDRTCSGVASECAADFAIEHLHQPEPFVYLLDAVKKLRFVVAEWLKLRRGRDLGRGRLKYLTLRPRPRLLLIFHPQATAVEQIPVVLFGFDVDRFVTRVLDEARAAPEFITDDGWR